MRQIKKEAIKPEMILSRLRKHLNEQRPVTLYNTFEGVPISYEAEVAMVNPDYIGLIVHPYQAVCIKAERRTYLQSKSMPAIVRAYPISIDYTNHVVMLKRLKIPQSISNDLHNSWVSPGKKVMVNIRTKQLEDLSAEMAEIAVLENNRVCVVISVSEGFSLHRQSEVGLSFRLDKNEELLHVKGVVKSLVKIRNQERKQLTVEGKASMGDEISILAFIAKREDQIMGKLDRVYQKLRKGKK